MWCLRWSRFRGFGTSNEIASLLDLRSFASLTSRRKRLRTLLASEAFRFTESAELKLLATEQLTAILPLHSSSSAS